MAAIVERGNGAQTLKYQRATGSSKTDEPPWEGEEALSMLRVGVVAMLCSGPHKAKSASLNLVNYMVNWNLQHVTYLH